MARKKTVQSMNAPRETELPSEEQRVADMDPEITEGREEKWKRGYWERRGAGGLCGLAQESGGQGYLSHIDGSSLTTLHNLRCLS